MGAKSTTNKPHAGYNKIEHPPSEEAKRKEKEKKTSNQFLFLKIEHPV